MQKDILRAAKIADHLNFMLNEAHKIHLLQYRDENHKAELGLLVTLLADMIATMRNSIESL